MTGSVRTLLASTLAGAALVASGCGGERHAVTVGETEGIYVDNCGLRYQVQLSRVLNPAEDSQYLQGVPEGEAPEADEAWFGIFLRVANTSEASTYETAEEFEIVDSVDNVYEPVEIETEDNPLAYEPTTLGPGELVPEPDSAAFNSPARGALLLFKPTLASLENRPLELEVRCPTDPSQVGIINLDV